MASATRQMSYDAALVYERLVEAADTLERIKVPDIQRNVTRWPEIVQAAIEATELNRGHRLKGPASPEAITRMDEALIWLGWIEKEAQRIVWCRVEGLSWRRIAAFAGLAPNTCRMRARAALVELAERLTHNLDDRNRSSRCPQAPGARSARLACAAERRGAVAPAKSR